MAGSRGPAVSARRAGRDGGTRRGPGGSAEGRARRVAAVLPVATWIEAPRLACCWSLGPDERRRQPDCDGEVLEEQDNSVAECGQGGGRMGFLDSTGGSEPRFGSRRAVAAAEAGLDDRDAAMIVAAAPADGDRTRGRATRDLERHSPASRFPVRRGSPRFVAGLRPRRRRDRQVSWAGGSRAGESGRTERVETCGPGRVGVGDPRRTVPAAAGSETRAEPRNRAGRVLSGRVYSRLAFV